jgi:hypothetical protein
VIGGPGGKATSSHTVDIELPKTLSPDKWVNQTLKLLPDVLWSMGMANISVVNRWNNVDSYTKYTIQVAYTAAWEVLDQDLGEPRLEVGKKRPETILRASIKKERVYVWLALNVLFTTAGVLHIILQQRNSRPVVIDTAAVAITTDASRLLAKTVDRLRWRSLSYVTKEDVCGFREDGSRPEERILLQLERHGDGFS